MMKKYKVTGFNVVKGGFIPHITEFISDSEDVKKLYSIGADKLIQDLSHGYGWWELESACHSFELSDITIWEPRLLGCYDLSGNYEVVYPKRVAAEGI